MLYRFYTQHTDTGIFQFLIPIAFCVRDLNRTRAAQICTLVHHQCGDDIYVPHSTRIAINQNWNPPLRWLEPFLYATVVDTSALDKRHGIDAEHILYRLFRLFMLRMARQTKTATISP